MAQMIWERIVSVHLYHCSRYRYHPGSVYADRTAWLDVVAMHSSAGTVMQYKFGQKGNAGTFIVVVSCQYVSLYAILSVDGEVLISFILVVLYTLDAYVGMSE